MCKKRLLSNNLRLQQTRNDRNSISLLQIEKSTGTDDGEEKGNEDSEDGDEGEEDEEVEENEEMEEGEEE